MSDASNLAYLNFHQYKSPEMSPTSTRKGNGSIMLDSREQNRQRPVSSLPAVRLSKQPHPSMALNNSEVNSSFIQSSSNFLSNSDESK